MKEKNVAVLILAAGASTRMGEPKQLLPWKDTTLIGHAIDVAKSVFDKNVFIVLGANFERIVKSVNLTHSHIVLNPDYNKGQGSSLSSGIEFLTKRKERFSGVAIILCDQPLISRGYLLKMLKAFQKGDKEIIASLYEQKAGVPAIFHQRYFKDLRSVHGDKGAKSLIASNKEDTHFMHPGELLTDIDTKAEYEYLLQKFGS